MNPDWLGAPQLSCQPGAVLARRRAYDAVGISTGVPERQPTRTG